MKIGLRGGHSPNCKGAIGILDEQAEVRKIYNALVPMLQAAGHVVINCNSDASTVSGELSEGTNKANSNNCDIYVTIHMNGGVVTANGTEIWMYDNNNAAMEQWAENICNRFAKEGFPNRGKKYKTSYHDLNASSMPAMIIETLFCTGADDVARYNKLGGAGGIAKLIAEGLTGKNVGNVPTSAPTPVAPTKPASSKPEVRFGVKTLRHGIQAQGVQGKANDVIVGIQIGVTQGSVEYRVHCGGRWLPKVTGANWNDHENGYAGDSKTPIDAIQVYYNTDIKKAGRYYSAVYAVKPYNQNGKLPQVEDTNFENSDGNNTAGIFGIPFTEFTIALK